MNSEFQEMPLRVETCKRVNLSREKRMLMENEHEWNRVCDDLKSTEREFLFYQHLSEFIINELRKREYTVEFYPNQWWNRAPHNYGRGYMITW